MWARLKRFFKGSIRRSRTIDDEPLNKVSIVIILLIDLFILGNVFAGLDDISRWHLSPNAEYPCHQEWQRYRTADSSESDAEPGVDREFEIARQAADLDRERLQAQYSQSQIDRIGTVDEVCTQYAQRRDAIKTPKNAERLAEIDDLQVRIADLQRENATIREQYDSALLEAIANQPPGQSINNVDAANAKQTLDRNSAQIETIEAEIATLRDALTSQPASVAFFEFLQQDSAFAEVDRGYQRAQFWYPSVQLALQALFLLPLLAIALWVHRRSQRGRYGLVALMSWHLLVIFSIPLVFKIFEFLQIGALFELVAEVMGFLFGSLLFLVSYVYILLIPAIGFGLIKVFQRFVFNPKVQAKNRVRGSRCIQCATKLAPGTSHCPHCGYGQYRECPSCHQPTYKYLPYCKACGADLAARGRGSGERSPG